MADHPDGFQSVCEIAREAALLESAADTLEWDERTGMPPEAGDYRAAQISKLRSMAHHKRAAAEYGDRLRKLAEATRSEDPHGEVGGTVRELFRLWQRDSKLPDDLVESIALASVRGQQSWDRARKANDFSMFRDALAGMLSLKREAAGRLAEGSDRSPYEALLDEYEPGASVTELDRLFAEIRGPLVDLISRARDAPAQPDVEVLKRRYPVDTQRRFCRETVERIGFDFRRGRLDETSHPFCTSLGPSDVRILTRYDERWFPGGFFGSLHEAGHGLYEQGLRADWFGLPPGMFASLGVHESQSRLWENQVGRSRDFWRWRFGEAQRAFAASLEDVSLEAFHFAINRVAPSLIRVEADEVTYNLHIIIRYDLERQLIAGELAVEDLPQAWNDRYESDLGIRPADDASGVLQDVHWGAGLFGYFPTYSLGNLIAAQLTAAAAEQLGELGGMFAAGEFEPLLEWLRRRVHRQGRCRNTPELVQDATGSPLAASHLIDELTGKVASVYQLGSS